ncbi:MAG: hypothetical protein JXR86_18695 [Spirochaetales bacterium]|nr:hypothetical protein [Spirochaetales bacterium]
MNRPDTHVEEKLVRDNVYIGKRPETADLPDFSTMRDKLPAPFWQGHESVISCYWKTWELAFSNLRNPDESTRFISPFIDTAFNGNLFLWDSVFILMFGKYGRRVFNFQQTLDNFYSHQHSDGYICREIRERDSLEMFERFDPSSTGPNLFGWSEWEYYLISRDKKRLGNIFPVLLAYSRWFRKHRTWQNGSYWSSGWGCGMDNQPRMEEKYNCEFDHGHMSWIDTTLQQIFNNRILIHMALVLGREGELEEEKKEIAELSAFVNRNMWDGASKFYFDRRRDGSLSGVKTIGAYWALLAEALPSSELDGFLSHLESRQEFNRPHMIPALSADNREYCEKGGYSNGGVWSPTNYMVLRGLSLYGRNGMAHRIGLNHLEKVVETYIKTGTLWENYAPEDRSPGQPARPDFVGWTGLSSVSILFEYVFGIRTSPDGTLLWDVRLMEKHGVYSFPFGEELIDLECAERSTEKEEPVIKLHSRGRLTLRVRWSGGEKTVKT